MPPNTPASPPRQDALGNKVPDPAEELALIEKELRELNIVYEKYFLGMERMAPARRKDQLAEKLRRLKNSGAVKNSMLKFRLEQLTSKFQTYERMWTRTVNEMENGTYRRDLFKLRMRQQRRAEQESGEPAPRPDAAGGEAAAERAPDSPPPPAPEPPSLSDAQVRALFETLQEARRRTNEPPGNLSMDSLGASLRKQVPELMRRYDCKTIDFKVVIRDGRALLKAVPRK